MSMKLENQAANIIDSSWHYSWHWKRNPHGELTLDGWKSALSDGESLAAEYEAKVREIRRFLPKLEAKVKQIEGWQRDDALGGE